MESTIIDAQILEQLESIKICVIQFGYALVCALGVIAGILFARR